ncbi:tetratricopeptide repeat protein [Chlorobium ferrooxidans]|uniref:TPR repeat n=1 Tax=Chlorobium ferrooxidans DSM 13031 TaxID=377431 RepID=Q0YUD6_9CHLB|nr:tetratricopeptide repeat protein [Chlorobium ferrooxidans]EAT60093.1 TPR repeat [Chlorobium ferrooxidans DSM 13031]
MTPSLPYSRSGLSRFIACALLASLTILTSCNRKSDEIANLQQQVWKNPQDAGGFMLLGNALARKQRYNEATEAFKNALAINPGLDHAEQALGTIAFNQKNYAGALGYFQKHLERAPKDSMRLYDVGNVYMQMQQYDKASSAYSDAIDNSEAFAEAHYNLAICYIHTGRRAEAEAIYEWLLVKNNYLAVSLQRHFNKEKSGSSEKR